jgi:hypothetical protein
MTVLTWDGSGQRQYETGVSKGVLYVPTLGVYDFGVAWNGLTAVTEAPSGAEATAQYADNIKYLNLISAEDFGATIEAYTYPPEFSQFDGSVSPSAGVVLGQQSRKAFGFSYQTLLGNDLVATDFGFKIHLVYGATAAPTEKAYATVNDSPEAITFSWEVSTIPVAVTGFKPTAILTIDSTKVAAAGLLALTNALYGTAGTNPRLPLPDEIIAMFAETLIGVTTVSPTATSAGVITIPSTTGVVFRRADTRAIVTSAATVQIPGAVGSSLVITATPATGYFFNPGSDDDWSFTKTV